MTNKCSLFKKCPFKIRKVFKNIKRLLLNMKSMLLSKKMRCPFKIRKMCFFKFKNMLFLNMENVIFLNTIKHIAFKYKECSILNIKCSTFKYEKFSAF